MFNKKCVNLATKEYERSRKMLKKKEKQHIVANEKAITLIALVVTIVILLILSVVSIAILTGKNGVINQAKGVKEKYE